MPQVRNLDLYGEVAEAPARTSKDVGIPSGSYEELGEHWGLIDDLLGGTSAMRHAGHKWLPQETAEKPDAYAVRLERSFLFEMLKDTIKKVVEKPFTQPVTLKGKLPEALEVFEKDADNQGTPLTAFAETVFKDAVTYGISYVLVDFPHTTNAGEKPLSMADEKALALRPYFVHLTAENLIGWHVEKGPGNRPRLTQIRWRECVTVPDGGYGEKKVERIRVMMPDTWEIWEKIEGKKEWSLVDSGTHTFKDIPLAVCYSQKTGFMMAEPPFTGLAWTNVEHWQSSSDQRNILRFARFALLFQKGVTQEEVDAGVTIGPSYMIRSTNPEADMKYVEHNGNAIKAGAEDIASIEARGEIQGSQPFMRKRADGTATANKIDDNKSHTSIYDWIRNLSECLHTAYGFAAKWANAGDLPDDFAISIFSEFGLSERAQMDIDALIRLRDGGNLSRETLLTEMKKRSVLDESVSVEDEIAAIEAEGPSLSDMTKFGLTDPDGNPLDPEEADDPGADPKKKPPFGGKKKGNPFGG